MPELPEVETTKKGLKKEVLGLKILGISSDLQTKDKRKKDTVANPKYFLHFKEEVVGQKILFVERRAKNILIHLSSGKTILIHLKMTGHLFYGLNPKIKYAHVVFSLSNKKYLVFSDLRKFGKITLLETKNKHLSKHLKYLGPEPLDRNFTFEVFSQQLKKKPSGKIKTVLMDQKILAGVGNIYSDEILWRAGIHPERLVKTLKNKELKRIFLALKETLKKGIRLGGDSTSDYLNLYGRPGRFQLTHRAYQRTGEKCQKKNCPGKIIRKMIGGRSAHFCSSHQK